MSGSGPVILRKGGTMNQPVEEGERAFTTDGDQGKTVVQTVVVSHEDTQKDKIEISDDLMFVNSYFDVERRSWHVLLVSRVCMGSTQVRVKRNTIHQGA